MEREYDEPLATAIAMTQVGAEPDERVQAALVHCYHPLAQRLALSIVHDPFDAATIAQDALSKALSHLGDLRSVESFEPWLKRIIVNTARSHLTREKRERRKVEAYAVEQCTESPVQPAPRLDASFSAMSNFNQMLNCLSQDERNIMALRFISDLGFPEIAAHLEMRLSATKMRYYRALNKLRVSLVDEAGASSAG